MRILFAILCLVASTAVADTWTPAAKENQTFTLGSPGTVRYGASKFVQKSLPAGPVACNNQTFTDPEVGVAKVCQILIVSSTPPCWPFSKAAERLNISTFPVGRIDWLASSDANASFSVTWWCRGKYQWRSQFIVGFRDEIPSDIRTLVTTFTAGSDAERQAAWEKSITCRPGDMTATCQRYNVLVEGARQQLGFGAPAPIVWEVARNGVTMDRPMYPLVAGARVAVAIKNQRAPVGAVCTCGVVAIEEKTSSYCPVEKFPVASLALCTLRK